MILRLSQKFGLALDPVTMSLVASAVTQTQSSGTQTTGETGTDAATEQTPPSTLNLIEQYARTIQGLVIASEKRRYEELLDKFRSDFGFGAIENVSNVKLLNLAMAFDLEIQRLQNEMAPANSPQGRIDRRYLAVFKILNAAIDTEAAIRGYKRIGTPGTAANAYFIKVEDLEPGAGSLPGVPNTVTTAKVGNIATIGLIGALAYMLFKK